MPVSCYEREMTEEERSRLLNFRECPVTPRSIASGILLALAVAGGIGAVLTGIASLWGDQGDTRLFGYLLGAVIVLAGGLLVVRDGFVRRKTRRAQFRELALGGIVEVTQIEFDRGWRVRGHRSRTNLVLEARPFVLVCLPLPRVKDKLTKMTQTLVTPFEPRPVVEGMPPRHRVVIEHACVQRDASEEEKSFGLDDRFAEAVLLTVKWTGEPLEPLDAGDYQLASGILEETYSRRDLHWLVSVLPGLARGPWMKP